MDTSKVTRVEVISKDGRRETWKDKTLSVKLALQDDGRTLKVFITDRKGEE